MWYAVFVKLQMWHELISHYKMHKCLKTCQSEGMRQTSEGVYCFTLADLWYTHKKKGWHLFSHLSSFLMNWSVLDQNSLWFTLCLMPSTYQLDHPLLEQSVKERKGKSTFLHIPLFEYILIYESLRASDGMAVLNIHMIGSLPLMNTDLIAHWPSVWLWARLYTSETLKWIKLI